MAERIQLDLLIETGGSLRTLQDLRDFINASKKDLEGLEIGSKEFNRLSAAIGSANTQLKSTEKQLAGLTREELAGAYARIGGGISSAFAAATATLQTFGIEGEAVTQAAVKAQNLLTIAISTRQIQEGLLSAKLLANVVAENARTLATSLSGKAQVKNTAATAAATTATEVQTTATIAQTAAQTGLNSVTALGTRVMQAFYAAVAANPFGAILALIGLLVGATIALNNAFKTTTTTTEQFNKALSQNIAEVKVEQKEIQILNSIVQSNTRSESERAAALEQLKKIVPGLKDVTLQQAGALEKINEAIKIQLPLLEAKARVDAASQILQEKIKAQLDLQAEGIDKYNFSLRSLISTAVNPYLGVQSRYNQFVEEGTKLNKESGQAIKILETEMVNYNSLMAKQNQIVAQNTESKKKNVRATKDQELAFQAFQKELKTLNDFLEQEIQIYKDLAKVQQAEDRLPEKVKKVTEALEERGDILEKTTNSFQRAITKIGILFNEENKRFEGPNFIDTFGLGIEIFRKEVADLIGRGDFESLIAFLKEYRQQAVELKETGVFDQTQLDSVLELTDNYENLANIFKRFPEISQVLGADFIGKYYKSLKDVNLVTAGIGFEFDNLTGKIQKASLKGVDINKARKQQETTEIIALGLLSNAYTKLYKGNEEDFFKKVARSKEEQKIIEDQVKSLKAQGLEGEKLAKELGKKVAQARLDAIKTNSAAIIEEENQIRSFFFQIQEGQLKLTESNSQAVNAALVDNSEAAIKYLGVTIDVSKKVRQNFLKDVQQGFLSAQELSQKYQVEFAQIQKELSDKGLSFFELSEEAKLKILLTYLQKQEEAEENQQKRRLRRIKELTTGFKEISDALQSFAQVFAQSYELQLNRLEIENKKLVEGIVGDDEQAAEKRLEIQKEYEAQQKEIQKKARITSLRFALLGATANTAEAISKSIALYGGTPAAFIASAIAAAANAAQIAIIAAQINQASQLKKGGLIRGQQGLIVRGPSHEQGGVMFGNGGYNLEGGEAVINRVSTKQYGGLLSQINQAGGGKPILVSSFDDSRIVDAIARQKSDPIRAYVVEQEISDKQAVAQRLSQISKF